MSGATGGGVPDDELIYQALRFYFWAAGEGLSPDAEQDCLEPEEGFWQYSLRSGDKAWETVAERYREAARARSQPQILDQDTQEMGRG